MLHPIVKWAQRKDKVFLQVQLRDITNQSIQLTETTLTFSGNSDKQKYGFSFEFFAQIQKNPSKWTTTGFHLIFVLQKKDGDAAFWPRLLKSKDKNQYLQVDWSKWIDQDEQQEQADKGMGGFDPSQMQNFGGMPGMGGMGGMPGMGGMGGFPGMGGMGGFPGMGGMGGMPGMGDYQGGQDEQQQNQEHVHNENCNHGEAKTQQKPTQ